VEGPVLLHSGSRPRRLAPGLLEEDVRQLPWQAMVNVSAVRIVDGSHYFE